jgi:serine/threonine protein phosphatase PrpC
VGLDTLFRHSVHLEVFARTDPGLQRRRNQDRFLVADLRGDGPSTVLDGGNDGPDGGHLTELDLGSKGGLLMVADGMGGTAGGALASALAARHTFEVFRREWMSELNPVPERFARVLASALEESSRVIHARAEEDSGLRGMGTTATAVGILEGFLYAGQVGDSRAYLVRKGEAHQLTRDQSVVQSLVEAGTLSEEEAHNSPHGNLILQALGTRPEVDVDLTYQRLCRGDVVLLCSDGLSGQVRRPEIAGVIGTAPDLGAAGDRLVELANERGGPDNITVVLARVEGGGLKAPRPWDVVARSVWEAAES